MYGDDTKLAKFQSFANRRDGTLKQALVVYAKYFETEAAKAMATADAMTDKPMPAAEPGADHITITPTKGGMAGSAALFTETAANARRTLAEWEKLMEMDDDVLAEEETRS